MFVNMTEEQAYRHYAREIISTDHVYTSQMYTPAEREAGEIPSSFIVGCVWITAHTTGLDIKKLWQEIYVHAVTPEETFQHARDTAEVELRDIELEERDDRCDGCSDQGHCTRSPLTEASGLSYACHHE